jgi:hypothetical protein
MSKVGLPYHPPQHYARVDPERATRIAHEYEKMKDEPDHPLVKAAYEAMINETKAQYEHAKKAGLKMEFWDPNTQKDPYEASPRLMTEDVRKNNHMYVFPTHAGFGHEPISEMHIKQNPLLRDSGERWNGQPVTMNDLFRAVHDYYGHVKEGVGFRGDGEENAWRAHASMFSPLARLALGSETRGQNSWLNYGPHGSENRTANTENTVFAPQKIGIMPAWVHHEGAEDFMHPDSIAEMHRLHKEHYAKGGEVDPLELAKSVKPVKRAKIGHNRPPSAIGSEDHPAWIPTRLGSEQDPTPADQPKISDLASLKATPNNLFGKNMNLVRNYINVPQHAADTMSDDELAEHFIGHMKDNLLALHDQVRPDIRKRSSMWYDGARAITDRQSAKYNLPDHSVAGVYAALSPQKDWFQNVSLGNRVLDIMHHHHDTPMDDKMLSKFMTMIKPTAKQLRDGVDPALAKYLDVAKMMHGKSMTDIDNMGLPNNERLAAKAMWLRLHDETYGDKKYHVVTPEGDDSHYALTDKGTNKKVAWGSFNEIGKAIASIENKDNPQAMSELMGEKHKVRNFYNNILVPNSRRGDITADTHAVAAALYRPLSGKSLEVGHNLDTSTGKGQKNASGSDITGIRGTYPLVAEAYRRAASERGVLPRQMQSITWEAIRGLFSPGFKSNKNNVKAIDNIWRDFRAGNITQDKARELTHAAASIPQGQIPHPSWHQEAGPSAGFIGPHAPGGLAPEQGDVLAHGPHGNPAGGIIPGGGAGSSSSVPEDSSGLNTGGYVRRAYQKGGKVEGGIWSNDDSDVNYRGLSHSPIVQHVLDKIGASLPAAINHIGSVTGRRH